MDCIDHYQCSTCVECKLGFQYNKSRKDWLTCYYNLYLGSFFLLCSFGIDSSLHCSWKQKNWWFNSSKICTIKQCSKCVWRMDDLDGGAQCQLLPGAHGARFGPEEGKESHEFRPEYCSAMWYIQPEARQTQAHTKAITVAVHSWCTLFWREESVLWILTALRSLTNPPLQISTEISTLSLAFNLSFSEWKKRKDITIMNKLFFHNITW